MKLRPLSLLAIALALLTGPAFAAKQVKVKQIDATRYEIDAFTLGFNELGGYLASLKEDEGIERVVLLNGKGDGETKFAQLAARLGLEAVRKNGDVIPVPAPPAPPTPPAAPAPVDAPAAPTAPTPPVAPETPTAAEAPASPEAPTSPEAPAAPEETPAEGDQH